MGNLSGTKNAKQTGKLNKDDNGRGTVKNENPRRTLNLLQNTEDALALEIIILKSNINISKSLRTNCLLIAYADDSNINIITKQDKRGLSKTLEVL